MNLFNYDPDQDRNRLNSDVHYRLYQPQNKPLTVICVQDFDYYDYDSDGFVSYDAYSNEREAELALEFFKFRLQRLLND